MSINTQGIKDILLNAIEMVEHNDKDIYYVLANIAVSAYNLGYNSGYSDAFEDIEKDKEQ